MEETDYLIGFELDVDKLVYAEILVNWPMRDSVSKRLQRYL